MEKKSSFEELGGKIMLDKISKIFYDKIYEHPWIGKFFIDIDQETIQSQQVKFMMGNLGGPKNYTGRLPQAAHKNMYITEELFSLREKMLIEAFEEAGACEELKLRWLKIDNAFKNVIVKKSLSECEKTFTGDEILDYPNPARHSFPF